jgi:hypothetical protein
MEKFSKLLSLLILCFPLALSAQKSYDNYRKKIDSLINIKGLAKIIAEKKLMVQPNPPRFLRAGDHIEFPVKIVNVTDSELTGQVQLQLFDPETNQPVDGWFSNRQANQYFTAEPMQSTIIVFPLDVPYEYNRLLDYRIDAKAAVAGEKKSGESSFTDGKEAMLPVLSNRMLVTESLPLNMPQGGTRDFHFDNLLKNGNDESISEQAFKIEFTTNPAWFALQSLPYLMEFPYECAEQVFNRFYANALGMIIINNSARIREFISLQKKDSSGLVSNLYRNPELKSVLIEETPWVMEAKNEEQQIQNLTGFLDLSRMNEELASMLNKLESLQTATGAFPWFKGEPDDRFITQYIMTGIGHLRKLGGISPEFVQRINMIVAKSMAWLDKKMLEDYTTELRKTSGTRADIPISPIQIQWLYMRSFFPELALSVQSAVVSEFFSKKAAFGRVRQNKMLLAMLSIWMIRTGKINQAKQILASIKENAIHNGELGIYWKDFQPGFNWFQSAPETISVLIEAFSEISQDNQSINELMTWLLRQKQTNHWSTTKATADACYALLLQGGKWLNTDPSLRIQIGNKELAIPASRTPGLGYFSSSIFPPYIKPEMGNIRVTLSPPAGEKKLNPAWGAAYWQYFDEADRIKTGNDKKGPLILKKNIFLKKSTDQGSQLVPITENLAMKPGDTITVRLELRSDRDVDYVQLKDLRASCMEPVKVISGFKWRDGLGYYEATGDASTNFFFSNLPKGVHVIVYDILITGVGSFTCGIATLQSMYAPEFTARSQSTKINTKEP